MAARRTTKKTDASADIAPDAPASDAPASERTTTSDPSARTSSGASREDIQLLLARSLFRADKWDPARDANAPFEWDPQRADYLARAARLIRLLDKDGLEVSQR